jgi:hypothetical protein
VVEGRFIYDCFILNEKISAVYFHGGQSALKVLPVITAATDIGKSTIVVNAVQEGAKWYYMTAATVAGLTAVTAGTAITTSAWTEMTANPTENITPTAGHKFVRVVCVDASNYPISVGDALINVGD